MRIRFVKVSCQLQPLLLCYGCYMIRLISGEFAFSPVHLFNIYYLVARLPIFLKQAIKSLLVILDISITPCSTSFFLPPPLVDLHSKQILIFLHKSWICWVTMVEIGFYNGCIHINPSPALDIALLWFSSCYLIVAAVRQHRIGQPWLGPTRACADFTDFKNMAISQKLSHLWS